MREILAKNKEQVVTGVLIFFSLGFLAFFQESPRLSPAFQSFVVAVIFFLVIPALYCKIILKRSLQELGFQRGDMVTGVVSAFLSAGIALALVIALAQVFPAFRIGHTLPFLVERSFLWFVLYEIFLVPIVVLLYEVFFRGFVQTLWLRHLGWRAILVQWGLFLILFLISKDFSWSNAPFLLFAPIAGFVAYRSHSIWYSLLASSLFFLLVDIFFLIFR